MAREEKNRQFAVEHVCQRPPADGDGRRHGVQGVCEKPQPWLRVTRSPHDIQRARARAVRTVSDADDGCRVDRRPRVLDDRLLDVRRRRELRVGHGALRERQIRTRVHTVGVFAVQRRGPRDIGPGTADRAHRPAVESARENNVRRVRRCGVRREKRTRLVAVREHRVFRARSGRRRPVGARRGKRPYLEGPGHRGPLQANRRGRRQIQRVPDRRRDNGTQETVAGLHARLDLDVPHDRQNGRSGSRGASHSGFAHRRAGRSRRRRVDRTERAAQSVEAVRRSRLGYQ